MPQIRQHIPAFCDGFEPNLADFATLDELLGVPWVASWSQDLRFHQYSHSDQQLVAEYDNGNKWYVIGTLTEVPEGLPEWQITPAGQAEVDRWNRGD